jgi:hypothetical protein
MHRVLVLTGVQGSNSSKASTGVREALRPPREALERPCVREIEYAAAGDTADVQRAAPRMLSTLLARPMTVVREQGGNQDLESTSRAMCLLFTADPGAELSSKIS